MGGKQIKVKIDNSGSLKTYDHIKNLGELKHKLDKEFPMGVKIGKGKFSEKKYGLVLYVDDFHDLTKPTNYLEDDEDELDSDKVYLLVNIEERSEKVRKLKEIEDEIVQLRDALRKLEEAERKKRNETNRKMQRYSGDLRIRNSFVSEII